MLLGRNLRSAYERVAKNRKSSSQDEQDSMSKNDSAIYFVLFGDYSQKNAIMVDSFCFL